MTQSRTTRCRPSIRRMQVCWFALLGCAGQITSAQSTDVIVADRPDFVNSASVIGASRFQFETGIAVERDRNNRRTDRTTTTPMLLRFGLGDRWELRLETAGYTVSRTTESQGDPRNKATGYGDLAIGMKWRATDNSGLRPTTAILATIETDSGSRSFRGNDWRPSLQFPAEWELADDWGLAVMPGVSLGKDDSGKRFYSGLFGIVVGKSWTERFRTFVELAAPDITRSKYGGTVASFDIGAAYLLSSQWQVNTALFKGLNDNTTDLAVTIGLSARF